MPINSRLPNSCVRRVWMKYAFKPFTTSVYRYTPASDQAEISSDESQFEFTRGRFVYNERNEMTQRRVNLDLDALGRVAAAATNSNACDRIGKFPDGMFNKAYLLTMDDGSTAVAKVPNPNAGLPYYTTASEVATMEFARDVLKTPVPGVYASCSNAADTPVGSEFILMEPARGVQLATVWDKMDIKSRFELVKSITKHQKAWMSVSFNKYGSIYYASDLGEDNAHSSQIFMRGGVAAEPSKFGIGPSVARDWTDDGRDSVEFDRGPWNTLEDRQLAVGYRESTSVRKINTLPKSPLTLCGPGTYIPTRTKKLQAIDCYLALVKYLLPIEGPIGEPHLWHTDLHVENIYVDPKAPSQITAIIDWQSTEIAPLFACAGQPCLLNHSGTASNSLDRPKLPDNLATLDRKSQEKVKAAYLDKSLETLYRTLVSKQNDKLYKAMQFRESTSFDLMLLAQNLLVDGEATYLAQVLELEKTWSTLPGVSAADHRAEFPCRFIEKERSNIESDVEGALLGMRAMQGVQDSMGDLFPEKGVVRPDQYDEAIRALDQIKEQVIHNFSKSKQDEEAWRAAWPFDTAVSS